MRLPSTEEWARKCGTDGEFRLAARHWTGGLVLTAGGASVTLAVENGEVLGTE